MTCPDCDERSLWCETCHGTHEVDCWRLVVPWCATALGLALLAWALTCLPARAADRCEPVPSIAERVCFGLHAALDGQAADLVLERFGVCTELAGAAVVAELDSTLVVALAWIESRLSHGAVSEGGARSALQVTPTTYRTVQESAGQSMTRTAVGLRVLGWRLAYHQDVVTALAGYTAGNVREERHMRWARAVAALAMRVRKAL